MEQIFAIGLIQVAGGLIHDDDGRVGDQGAGNGYPPPESCWGRFLSR
jgi:hypothetical protein